MIIIRPGSGLHISIPTAGCYDLSPFPHPSILHILQVPNLTPTTLAHIYCLRIHIAMTLASLPVKISVKIFQALQSFDVAISLASCSHHFHAIFEDNKRSIWPSVLRYDPIVNSTTISFYDKAVTLHRLQQQKYFCDGSIGISDYVSQSAPITVSDIPSLDTVAALIKNAHIINRTADAMRSHLYLRHELGYDDSDRAIFDLYADELLREALYDTWILLQQGGKLIQPFNKGMQLPWQHPHNELVSRSFCTYLTESEFGGCGFPNPEAILPAALRQPEGLFIFSFGGTPQEQMRQSLLAACGSRQRNLLLQKAEETRRRCWGSGGGECGNLKNAFAGLLARLPSPESARSKDIDGNTWEEARKRDEDMKATIMGLQKRIAELEASEVVLKARVETSEVDIRDMKRKWKQKFGT